jgi:prepilin-type N-terminal cleavage/methylation domain-containing protein/prepilin-type processing-associated H-X9-DG protein
LNTALTISATAGSWRAAATHTPDQAFLGSHLGKNFNKSQNWDAFTLLELLVTIGIISLLAAFLLPMISKAKSHAKTIVCINNAKQLINAWQMYSTDQNDLLVANGRNDKGTTSRPLWVQGQSVDISQSTNEDYILNPQFALFAPYIQSAQNYLCPNDKQTVAQGANIVPARRNRSYAMNPYMGWVGPWDGRLSTNFQIFRTQSHVASAMTEAFVFQDGHPNSICWPFFGVQMERDAFYNFPNSTHNGQGVLAFSDGHVERHRWVDPRTVEAKSAEYHSHFDKSPNNEDIYWLRSVTTVPNEPGN